MKAILLPPQDVSPYFPHNFGSQEKPDRKYCVCFTCANNNNVKFCNHKEKYERAITVTTTVAELNYGLTKKNYKLLQVCELYSYKRGVRLFKDFVENVEEFKSTLSDPVMTKFIKSGLNKSYGYFMLKDTEQKQKLCTTLSDFQNLLENKDVIDFDLINDKSLDVSYKDKPQSSTTNCFTNISLGAHILAYSRMAFDQKITMLKENFKSMKIYMLNIDAIAFSLSIQEETSRLKLDNEKIGAFKSEIKNLGEILSFQALSPHLFNLTYTTQSGELKNLSKVCGFSLQNSMNSELLNQELFKHFLSEAMDGKQTSVSSTQVRYFSKRGTNEVQKTILDYQLRNTLFQKRIIRNDYSTLPFGYTKRMTNTYVQN